MFQRILATIALSFIAYIGISQNSFHRIYETSLIDATTMTDSVFHHMTSATNNSGDVFAVGTKRVNDDDGSFEDFSVVFVKLNNKGDIDWQRELDLGKDSVEISSICDLSFNGTQDSLLFVVDVEVNGEGKQYYGTLPTNGSDIELLSVGGFVPSTIPVTLPKVASFITGSDLLLSHAETNTILSRLLPDETLLWSRAYVFNNEDGTSALRLATDLNTGLDSSIVLTGTSDVDASHVVAAKLDSNGVQLWAESLIFTNSDLVSPNEIIPLSNGNVAIVGAYAPTSSPDVTEGFVTILDTLGEVVLAKTIQIDGVEGDILDVLEGSDGNLWITGIQEKNDSTRYFMTNMDFNGTINYTTFYPGQLAGESLLNTDLLPVPATGGATFVGHGFKNEQTLMAVMKHDELGMAFCSDTIPGITIDLVLDSDTLTTDVTNGGIFFDTLVYEYGSFAGFTPPELSVNTYPPFCPNEVIDTILVATVSRVNPENVTYLWSNGEINDTIRVFEEGMYSVTVTVSEDVCFMMCDTVELTRLTLPMVAIGQDNSQFCAEGLITLLPEYTPGAAIETYMWSTGEMTETITVSTEGVYSVTITDACGEMANATINMEFPDIAPTVVIVENPCVDFSSTLTAFYGGIGSSLEFEWSTGENTETIMPPSNGTYSVTVTDDCGDSVSASFDFEYSSEIESTTIGTSDIISSICSNSPITIFARATSSEDSLLQFSWSDNTVQTVENQGESSIFVTEPGEYFVTITDACGASIVLSQVVEFPIIATEAEIIATPECDEDNVSASTIVFEAVGTGEGELNLQVIIFDSDGNAELQPGNNNPTGPIFLADPLNNTQFRNFDVEVTNVCGEVLDSLSIQGAVICGGFLRYPIAFFPSGDEDGSRRFGPIPSDTMDVDMITDVDFKVFNRWGETVHEATEILDAWDGTHNGEPAPSEVYIWYVTYIFEGRQFIDKGDVTLIR